MAFYIINGNVAYWPDGQTPPWSDPYVPTADPNAKGTIVAPKDSWYALTGNGGRVYIRAGNPVPTGATSYQAIDDQGTFPPDPNGGVIHQPPATDAASWTLPGRGQFENQAWTGPSDWRGVPFVQKDTQGRPLSQYNNAVDQLQASRQPISVGEPFARWAFGNGILNQQQTMPTTNTTGILPQTTPRVAVDKTFQTNFQPPVTPTPTPTAPTTPTPQSTPTATNTGLFGPFPNMGAGSFTGQPSPASQWMRPGDLGYQTRDDMYAAQAQWLAQNSGLGSGPGSLWQSSGAAQQYAPYASQITWQGGLPYVNVVNAAHPTGGLEMLQFWGSGAPPK